MFLLFVIGMLLFPIPTGGSEPCRPIFDWTELLDDPAMGSMSFERGPECSEPADRWLALTVLVSVPATVFFSSAVNPRRDPEEIRTDKEAADTSQ